MAKKWTPPTDSKSIKESYDRLLALAYGEDRGGIPLNYETASASPYHMAVKRSIIERSTAPKRQQSRTPRLDLWKAKLAAR